jgi:hypothetical protein
MFFEKGVVLFINRISKENERNEKTFDNRIGRDPHQHGLTRHGGCAGFSA